MEIGYNKRKRLLYPIFGKGLCTKEGSVSPCRKVFPCVTDTLEGHLLATFVTSEAQCNGASGVRGVKGLPLKGACGALPAGIKSNRILMPLGICLCYRHLYE